MGLFHEAPGPGALRRASIAQSASEPVVAAEQALASQGQTAQAEGWRASLRLAFERREQRTVLARNEHLGPLRVQRAFYPERDGSCHVYMLHPPGGIASGDTLRVDVDVGPEAAALLTTPGAGKLYRSRGVSAELSQTLRVASGGCLEWFPQELIAFSGAQARLSLRIELAADAVYAGWEILCLGRPACAERFERGELASELSLSVAGQLRFMERASYEGDAPVLSEAWGLGGAPVTGSFLVVHPGVDEAWVDAARSEVEARAGVFAVTLLPGLLIARYLGHSTLDARACFERIFAVLRPRYAGRAATPPRIWRT